jgi:phosphate-selective porin
VDLDDGPIQGGRMRVLMTGLNWYWNQYIRLQFNYGFAEVDGGSSPGNLHILEARFEGQF